jgi:Skp family chaperone for outer membrane proteins
MKKQILLILLTSMLAVPIWAQDTAPQTGSLTEGTISSQFDHLLKISNNYQDYKVIKKTHLDQIRANVMDSINVFKKELGTIQADLVEKENKIKSLEAGVSETQKRLDSAEAAVDSFEFLGLQIHKSTYANMMWAIVGLLTAGLLFFLFKYSQSHQVIAKAQKDLAETMEEFEQHRKNTLERERKLKRELIDAMNGKVS